MGLEVVGSSVAKGRDEGNRAEGVKRAWRKDLECGIFGYRVPPPAREGEGSECIPTQNGCFWG